jgi:hypothetical protein
MAALPGMRGYFLGGDPKRATGNFQIVRRRIAAAVTGRHCPQPPPQRLKTAAENFSRRIFDLLAIAD